MFRESTTQLLRPSQEKECRETADSLRKQLEAPPHILAQIQDIPGMRRQLSNVEGMLQGQSPKPYAEADLDAARGRLVELEKSIPDGMPTDKEMRRNRPGAVGKNLLWEKTHKKEVLEWKNINKRLAKTGHVQDKINDPDLCNVERLRPSGVNQEGNFDNSQIKGKEFHMDESPRSVVFDDSELKELDGVDSELRGLIGTATANQRAGIKKFLMDSKSETKKEDMRIKCGAPKANGDPCGFFVSNEGDRCRHHKD